jgi:hypothetical protein
VSDPVDAVGIAFVTYCAAIADSRSQKTIKKVADKVNATMGRVNAPWLTDVH